MTAVEIIEEIRRLPKEERLKVAEFARRLTQARPLSPEELGALAKRMVETQDPSEADRLQEDIIKGFYGGEPRA